MSSSEKFRNMVVHWEQDTWVCLPFLQPHKVSRALPQREGKDPSIQTQGWAGTLVELSPSFSITCPGDVQEKRKVLSVGIGFHSYSLLITFSNEWEIQLMKAPLFEFPPKTCKAWEFLSSGSVWFRFLICRPSDCLVPNCKYGHPFDLGCFLPIRDFHSQQEVCPIQPQLLECQECIKIRIATLHY